MNQSSNIVVSEGAIFNAYRLGYKEGQKKLVLLGAALAIAITVFSKTNK